MSLAALIRDMAAAGATPEAIAIAVEAIEAANSREADRKAKRAKQKADERERARLSRDKDATVARQSPDMAATVGADLPTPVSPLGPSPRPLTQNPPLSPTIPAAGASANVLDGELLPPSPSPTTSPPPRSSRGCRIPPGFPGDSERDWCRTEARMTDDEFDECAAEFRDYWSGVPGQRGVKCDWPATFRNAARKRISGSRSRPSFAAGNQHSNGSRLGAYQRAAAFVRAENDVPQ